VVAGFDADKVKGVQLVEEAARFPGETTLERRSRLCSGTIRERRYDDALNILATLRQRLPRNRIPDGIGATALRAGRAAEADRSVGGSPSSQRTRGRRCSARLRCGITARSRAGGVETIPGGGGGSDDRADERRTTGAPRAHRAGEDRAGARRRATARRELDLAIKLAEADSDGSGARQAKALRDQIR
jgi:hypothetical protein